MTSGRRNACFPLGLVAVALAAHFIGLFFLRHGPMGFDAAFLAAGSLAGVSLLRLGHWLRAGWPLRFVLVSAGAGIGFHCWLTLTRGPPGPGWLGFAFGLLLAFPTVGTGDRKQPNSHKAPGYQERDG